MAGKPEPSLPPPLCKQAPILFRRDGREMGGTPERALPHTFFETGILAEIYTITGDFLS